MEGGGVVVKGRVTIDTRPPFRSVKEAVSLFGEKVLAGEVYGPKLEKVMMESKSSSVGGGANKQVGTENRGALKTELEETKQRLERSREEGKLMMECKSSSVGGGANKQVGTENRGALKTELEETKQRLERSREEGKMMANTLQLLTQELEQKRKELRNLQSMNLDTRFYYDEPIIVNPDMEEIKFVSNNNHEDEFEFQHQGQNPALKKFVSFASPPSLVKEIDRKQEEGMLERVSSFRKEGKKKSMGWLFSWKKRNT